MNNNLKNFQNLKHMSNKINYENSLKNSNIQITTSYNEHDRFNNINLKLIKENEELKKKLFKSNNKINNLKRSRLRLKNNLNKIIIDKNNEINRLCEKHFIETSKLIEDHDKKLEELNNRFLLLTSDVQSTISDLSANLATDLNNNRVELESSFISESDSVKKEIGKLYDKIDELYKELVQVTNVLDNAKETFLGKYIIK